MDTLSQPAPRVHAVDHLHVEVPVGSHSEIVRFYGELLGLERLTNEEAGLDDSLAFGRERLQVRFVPCERPRIARRRRRLTLTVDSVDAVQERLAEAKQRSWCITGLSRSERALLVVDPFDQIVELRQSSSLECLRSSRSPAKLRRRRRSEFRANARVVKGNA